MTTSPSQLRDRMREGTTRQDGSIAAGLGLPESASEADLARTLVRHLAADAPTVAPAEAEPSSPRHAGARASSPDVSFLARLGAGGRDVERLGDLETLLGVLQGGRLAQRRSAARRIAVLVREGDLEPEALDRIEGALAGSRDEDVAFEVLSARAALPGAAGREARDEDGAFATLSARVAAAVKSFWLEEAQVEPLGALASEELALLALRSRDLPDGVLEHLAAVLEGADGVTDVAARAHLASVFRSAGDARLVPTLANLASGRPSQLVYESIRALGRTEDPRVLPALERVFERASDPTTRALAGGALGLLGSGVAHAFLRELLASDDRRLERAAAEAIREIGTPAEVDRLCVLLERSDETLAMHAARALGQIGDSRALASLRRRTAIEGSSLAAEIDEALLSIAAQMVLRGEGAPHASDSSTTARRGAIRAPDRSGLLARLIALGHLLVGRVLIAFGATDRAIARFERSAASRPTWAAPLANIGLAQLKRGRLPAALAVFRRALSADRGWVEARVSVARAVARAFLRRAEEIERSGQRDIALGLLEEVRALDLRRVDEPLRFEIGRRADRLRAEVHA